MEKAGDQAAPTVSGRSQPWYAPTGPIAEWSAVALFALFATAMMVYPVLRAFSMVQISYNEG